MKLRALWISGLALAALAGTANAQISNSAHNFSGYGWSGGEICKPCHTPHFSNTEVGFLWNHALTTATYTMFEGNAGTAVADLDERSRMCMSCHDGTVALDSFGGVNGTTIIDPEGRIGTDLTNDHPIGSSAIYPVSQTSTSYNPQNLTTHQVSAPGQTWGSLRLRSWINPSSVEEFVVGCTTCHTVHNSGNWGHMLRFSNAGSHLCLTCHIK